MKRRIVFAGDSIIHGGPWQYWLPDHYVTNFAFPGHTTSDMADLMEDIVKSQPELLVVMIGTNDFGKHRLPEDQVIKNILANVEKIHSLIPGIPVIWSSLSPRSDEFSQSMIVVNNAIRPVIENLGMIYFDVFVCQIMTSQIMTSSLLRILRGWVTIERLLFYGMDYTQKNLSH
jgi:lysophospholipase L1-like esterase